MATRSTIALEYADGSVDQIYCHWDGYISHNGRILKDHYSDPFKLQTLIDLGDLSSLGPEIGTKHEFGKGPDAECDFYGRDRGDEECGKKVYSSYNDYRENSQNQEFNYILRRVNGKPVWYVRAFRAEYDCTLDEAFEYEAQEG